MYIRRVPTRKKSDTERYFSYRLVESRREGDRVRQRTLLNLGSHFPIPKERWPALVDRVQALLARQADLGLEPDPDLEREADLIAQRLLARSASERPAEPQAEERATHAIYEDSLDQVRVRATGIEAVGLWALRELGLEDLLQELSGHASLVKTAMASIAMRLAEPGSERRTHLWLRTRSAAGELLGVDFERQSLMQLYRASDLLMSHRDAIEEHLFERLMTLFNRQPTVTLYDLTNTYFEGQAKAQDKARHGKSKERRSDCPLLTLALVLDGSGAIQRSRVFAGNQSEPATLEKMLKDLEAGRESLIVLDRGTGTEERLEWLREQGYRYLAKSRRRQRDFDPEQARAIPEREPQKEIQVFRALSDDGSEAFVHCLSKARAEKELAIATRQRQRLEAGLRRMAEGLSRKGARKDPKALRERVGRLKGRYPKVGRHYAVSIETSDEGQAVSLAWEFSQPPNSMLASPGVYDLRTNVLDQDANWLWKTYTRLTEIESVFRSLKSELGLRPIFHQKPKRAEGHLFISVIAYQALHLIRSRLQAQGIHDSWDTLKTKLGLAIRATSVFQRTDGKWLHIRKSAGLTPDQAEIFRALGLPERIGPVTRTIVEADATIPA